MIEKIRELLKNLENRPWSVSSPPIPVIYMQQDLHKSRRTISNKNAVYFTLNDEKQYSIIIETLSSNDSKETKTTIIDGAIENNLTINNIFILPLNPISSYPIINVLDEISSNQFLSQKSKQYWESDISIENNIKEYYLDYLNYRKELCLTYFPELELYKPYWIYGMSAYIIYNSELKTQSILYYENKLNKNIVYSKVINEKIDYNTKLDIFKKYFDLPSNKVHLSSYTESVGTTIDFFNIKKHPFILAINDIKEGIKKYNDQQDDIDFDALKITYSDLFNRTIKYITAIRALSNKYKFLRYYFRPWIKEMSVNIMYYVEPVKTNQRPDGEIILSFTNNQVDEITITKVKNKQEFRELRNTIYSKDEFIERYNSSLSYYYKDKIKYY